MKVELLGIRVKLSPAAMRLGRVFKKHRLREGLLYRIGKRLAYVVWDGCSSAQAIAPKYIEVIHDSTANQKEKGP